MHFQTTGTHYVSPVYYRHKSKKESKPYIFLLTCSVCRAAHLELAENLTSKEFIKCSKEQAKTHLFMKFEDISGC